jgi:hypothetical protein
MVTAVAVGHVVFVGVLAGVPVLLVVVLLPQATRRVAAIAKRSAGMYFLALRLKNSIRQILSG